jgi:ATP-dependent Clp protease ATP-binding subunit ClpA
MSIQEQISPEAENILQKAFALASERNMRYCTTEHVLLALLSYPPIESVFIYLQADANVMIFDVEDFLESNIEKKSLDSEDPTLITFDNLLRIAIMQASMSQRKKAEPRDLLVAMFKDISCQAKFILESHDISYEGVTEAIVKLGLDKNKATGSSLEKDYLTNLNEKAISGKIDGLIGRDDEIDRIIQILCRRRKNNPILVGDPGVGKTAIAEGLALKIVNKQVPTKLHDAVVLSLDIGSLMAGTKFRGDLEGRMKDLIKLLKETPNSILFIDEIHTIIGSGSSGDSTLDVSNILKPMLSNGEIKCIGSTTSKEYNNVFEKDSALSRRFQKVDIIEPSIEDTIKILAGLKSVLESHHQVTYEPGAIEAATELSAKHINDRFLPDKAIDILDEAGSRVHLDGKTKVTVKIIEKTLSKIARIPEKSVSAEQKNKLEGLYSSLKLKIFGQDSALETVVSSIEMSSSGLSSGEKPIGSFLFCGPTGVGKTELCKQLSQFMGVPLIRFDMSEYMEKHTVSKLIGAPPGYVGYEQNGLLTDAVRRNPHSIILLDEIEKAHHDVWDLLLQIMDHGSLTDNNGKVANFKHSIIVMTSNVGATDLSKRSIGFAEGRSNDFKPTAAIESTFSPEFRNRLDAVVYFNRLSKHNINDVLNKNLKELDGQLLNKNVFIKYSADAKQWLIDNGYDPKMGARPMARLIQDKIKKPLSSEILYGKLQFGGEVLVSLDNKSLKFEYTSKTKQKEKNKETTKA